MYNHHIYFQKLVPAQLYRMGKPNSWCFHKVSGMRSPSPSLATCRCPGRHQLLFEGAPLGGKIGRHGDKGFRHDSMVFKA